MPKKVTITIPADPTEGIKIVTDGFSGTQCLKATQAIKEALGQTKSQDMTEESYNIDASVDLQADLGME